MKKRSIKNIMNKTGLIRSIVVVILISAMILPGLQSIGAKSPQDKGNSVLTYDTEKFITADGLFSAATKACWSKGWGGPAECNFSYDEEEISVKQKLHSGKNYIGSTNYAGSEATPSSFACIADTFYSTGAKSNAFASLMAGFVLSALHNVIHIDVSSLHMHTVYAKVERGEFVRASAESSNGCPEELLVHVPFIVTDSAILKVRDSVLMLLGGCTEERAENLGTAWAAASGDWSVTGPNFYLGQSYRVDLEKPVARWDPNEPREFEIGPGEYMFTVHYNTCSGVCVEARQREEKVRLFGSKDHFIVDLGFSFRNADR